MLKEQCHGAFSQNRLQMQEMCAKFIEYKLNKLQINDRKQFLKEFCIATVFLQNFKDFRVELEYFSKIHVVSHLHPSHH